MTDETQEYVYAIGHPHEFVKIGRSKNPTQRLKSHQTSCPYNLYLVTAVPVDDSDEVEKRLHERWSDKQVRGEWFDIDPEDYDVFVDMAKMEASNFDFESVEEFRKYQQEKTMAVL
jgi:hypothetical protein